jgi:outer membrane protein assembly factor BamE (lipoprotein component of BamABCDE complex)
MNSKSVILITSIAISLSACTPASKHAEQVRANDSDRISVGKVQREIRVGMSSADVVAALGSPNIVTTDEQRREQWVYDKIATENVYSRSSGGVGALILYFPSVVLGGSGTTSASAGANSTQQRTLTVIIKFDKNHKVRDFAYHNSSF